MENYQSSTSAPGNTFYCSKCGTANISTDGICSGCHSLMAKTEVNCPKCGKANPVDYTYCLGCHAPLHLKTRPNLYKKTSVPAKIWIILCIIVNFVLGVQTLSTAGNYSRYQGLLMFIGIVPIALALGFLLLLIGKKAGFTVIILCVIIAMIANILLGNFSYILIGLINPIITWALIKNTWDNMT